MLNTHGIDYAVIGALAVAVHSVVRASVDADAVVAAAVPQLRELQNKLMVGHLSVELRTGGVDDPIAAMTIAAMMIVTDRYGNRVDLLAGIQGLDGGVYGRSITLQPSGIPTALKIVGREDLTAMKIAAGSPKNLMDSRVVLRLQAVRSTSTGFASLRGTSVVMCLPAATRCCCDIGTRRIFGARAPCTVEQRTEINP